MTERDLTSARLAGERRSERELFTSGGGAGSPRTMVRVSARTRARPVAICAAILAFAPSVRAQPQIVERLRLQGSFITLAPPPPAPRVDDIFISAVPELSATWFMRRTTVNITYSITGALHTLGSASEIANRAGLLSAFELSPRTALLLGVDASQTSTGNFLIQESPTTATVSVYPSAGTRLITGRLSQALRHELSPVLIATQDASAQATTTLPPAPPLNTFVASLGGGIERIWRSDGLGVSLTGGYALTQATPPQLDTNLVTITAGPRWRHDWSRSVSSSATAGATYLFSPDPGTEDAVAPAGSATVLYFLDPASVDLSYSVGIFPSPLTGLVLRSHRVVLHATAPISERRRIFIGGSIGALRANIVSLRNLPEQGYDALSADLDLSWQATEHMNVYARYQTITQIADVPPGGVDPSFIRDTFLVGVQLSSERVQIAIPTRFAQRVDGGDAPLRPEQQRALEEQRVQEIGLPIQPAPPPQQPARPGREDEENDGTPAIWRRQRPQRENQNPQNPQNPNQPPPGRSPADRP